MKSSISRLAAQLFTTRKKTATTNVVAALGDKTEAVIRELEARHKEARFLAPPPAYDAPDVQRFRYAPSTRPKNTIADATPVKRHTASKPLPNGRSKLNPSASIATQVTPLIITGQLIGTSDSPRHSPWPRCGFYSSRDSLIACAATTRLGGELFP